MTIVLSFLLLFTASDYRFSIFSLVLFQILVHTVLTNLDIYVFFPLYVFQIADLSLHENVICQKYHEKSVSIVESFVIKIEEIIEGKSTEDSQLTPEIATYEEFISKSEKT